MKPRNFIAYAVFGAVLLSGVLTAQAQTATSSSLQDLLQSLKSQVAALQSKLNVLQSAQTDVNVAAGSVTGTLKLIAGLRQGATGEDVKLLQTILAANPDIYPEGLISGFYGGLTARAVARFQKLHDLEQVGSVGPKTLEKLNKDLEDNPVSKEKDNNGNENHCAIVPPGHLIAPGWLRKHDGVRSIVPACQKLPEGIWNLLRGTSAATTTARDNFSPVLSGILAASITSSSTHITWATNELATSRVSYGTTTLVQAGAAGVLTIDQAALVVAHDIYLTGLAANTTYYFVVSSVDASGNIATSGQFAFTTPIAADVVSPAISSLSAGSIASSSATINWTTNELADSKVWYSTVPPVVAGGPSLFASASGTVFAHAVPLTGLATSTVYHYIVSSADASGNIATTSEATFTTLAQ